MLSKSLPTAGPLPSTGVTRLHRYYQPLRHPLACQPISRCSRLYGLPCSRDFSPGRGGLLQLLSASSSPCRRYHPAGVPQRFSQFALRHAAFVLRLRTRPPGLALSGPPLRSLALRPGDSPTTLYDGRVDGLQGISFLPPCHPNYGVLALSPAGLSPAERASLCWTHNRACGFPAPGSRTRSCRRPRKTFACSAFWSVRTLLELLGVSTSLHVLASFLRCSRTEAPSLRRHYPTSPVLRASPPPRRPKLVLADSRLARAHATDGASRVAAVSLLHACRRQYPGGTGRCRVTRFPTAVSLPRINGGSASALPVSRPAQRSLRVAACVLAESPTGDPSSSDCFSAIRYLPAPLRLLPAGATVAGRDSHPLGHSAFPRRTLK